MRSAIHVSALLLALGACLGLATAHQHYAVALDETVGLGTTQEAAIVDDYDVETGITGNIALASVPRLSLSDEQRGLIFLAVINLPDAPELTLLAPEPGMSLPPAIEMQEIPAMVVRRIPELDGYRFVKLEDRILIVSAATREVESMIPRYKLVFH
jgi:hypothetical protein